MVANRKRKRGKRDITTYILQDLDSFDSHVEEQVWDTDAEYVENFSNRPLVFGSDNDADKEKVGEFDPEADSYLKKET